MQKYIPVNLVGLVKSFPTSVFCKNRCRHSRERVSRSSRPYLSEFTCITVHVIIYMQEKRVHINRYAKVLEFIGHDKHPLFALFKRLAGTDATPALSYLCYDPQFGTSPLACRLHVSDSFFFHVVSVNSLRCGRKL